MSLKKAVITVFVVFFFANFIRPAGGVVWAGKNEILPVSVSYIIDGDSIMVEKDKRELEIRLWGIDAPEYNQKGAEEARTALSSLILHTDITIEIVDRDKYGRFVALARKGPLNVNEYMVRSGYAWVHIYYCKAKECDTWYVFEHEARRKKRGIWKYDNQVPPWEWKAKK